MNDLPDPRRYPDASEAAAEAAALYTLAERSLAAATGQHADAANTAIVATVGGMLVDRDGSRLAMLLDRAPTLAIYRHLWRIVATAAAEGDGSMVALFAIPVVVVASMAGGANARAVLSGVLPDPGALASLLQDHRALAGNRTFALSNALVAADAIDLPKLPGLLAASRGAGLAEPLAPVALSPAPIDVRTGERAHLRFLVGSAVAAAGSKLTRDETVGRWGLPLARALIAQLAAPGVSLVALPRSAMPLPAAVTRGRGACREVALQLFVSQALRELRAKFGEPVAVISAHVAQDAPGGGELRLSLSSPFSPRDASGFRCPLYQGDGVADVATMLVDLLRDCRVSDVRVLSGVHADRDPVNGRPLLFKLDTIPAAARLLRH